MLLEKGASCAAEDNEGVAPLFIAYQAGHANVVEQFTLNGCDLAATNKFGDTPLHIAATG